MFFLYNFRSLSWDSESIFDSGLSDLVAVSS